MRERCGGSCAGSQARGLVRTFACACENLNTHQLEAESAVSLGLEGDLCILLTDDIKRVVAPVKSAVC
jgi:hypothetical protein